jgi:KaiC/GvpD/RAD55 family RecA-like ATPase
MEALLDLITSGSMRVFLLKGAPGTGKSVFAKELLRMKGRGTFISTNPLDGRKESPTSRPKDVVFETISSDTPLVGSRPPKDWNSTEMAERILELVMESIQRRPKGMIVIDSWATVARTLDDRTRFQLEQRLVAVAKTSDSMLVVINDQIAVSSLEFLVDGVAELKREVHQGATLRSLEIQKLTESPIIQPSVIFTLAGGRFRMFGPPRIMLPGQYAPSVFEPTPQSEDRYSTGIPDMDRLNGGGVPRGSTVSVELGEGVPLDSILVFHHTRIANFIQNGGCVVGLPTSGIPPEANLGPLRAFLPPGSVESSMRLGFYRDYANSCTFPLNIDSLEQTFLKLWQKVAELKGPAQRPCYIFIGVEKLQRIHGEEGILKNLVVSLTRVKFNRDLLTLFVDSMMSTAKAIAAITDFNFLIENRMNAMTFQPRKPSGPINVVEFDYSHGYPEVHLTPIL